MKTALFVVGVTASGKSELAMQLAERGNLGIINMDSVQVYQDLVIGSAGPTEADTSRCPHYLYYHVKSPEEYSAAQYQADVKSHIEASGDAIFLFCGGSGFYMKALTTGSVELPELTPEVHSKIEDYISTHSWPEIKAYLAGQSERFGFIHENDHYRLRRGLEVCLSGGLELYSGEREAILSGYKILKYGIWWEREDILKRVQARTASMLSSGFVDEVEGLLALGLENWAPLQTVGYKQVCQYLSGKSSKMVLEQDIVTATMQLIKKQRTWFRKDTDIQWVSPREVATELVDKILSSSLS